MISPTIRPANIVCSTSVLVKPVNVLHNTQQLNKLQNIQPQLTINYIMIKNNKSCTITLHNFAIHKAFAEPMSRANQ